MANNNVNDVAMTWNDEIQNDGEGFRVLPEGEYDFTVTDFARGRFEGSAKMSACPKAELTITLHDPDGDVTVTENLFLNRKAEWKLCQFFTAIRHRMPGEVLKMNWSRVKGSTGRCKVGIRTWVGNDGKEHESNEIVSFINPFKEKYGEDRSQADARAAYERQAETQRSAQSYTQEPLTSATQPRKWTGGQF